MINHATKKKMLQSFIALLALVTCIEVFAQTKSSVAAVLPGKTTTASKGSNPQVTEKQVKNLDVALVSGHKSQAYYTGKTASITVLMNKTGYLYLLYRNSTGNISLIFPGFANKDNKIEATASQRLPISTTLEIPVSAAPGRDTILAILSDKPLSSVDKLTVTEKAYVAINKSFWDFYNKDGSFVGVSHQTQKYVKGTTWTSTAMDLRIVDINDKGKKTSNIGVSTKLKADAVVQQNVPAANAANAPNGVNNNPVVKPSTTIVHQTTVNTVRPVVVNAFCRPILAPVVYRPYIGVWPVAIIIPFDPWPIYDPYPRPWPFPPEPVPYPPVPNPTPDDPITPDDPDDPDTPDVDDDTDDSDDTDEPTVKDDTDDSDEPTVKDDSDDSDEPAAKEDPDDPDNTDVTVTPQQDEDASDKDDADDSNKEDSADMDSADPDDPMDDSSDDSDDSADDSSDDSDDSDDDSSDDSDDSADDSSDDSDDSDDDSSDDSDDSADDSSDDSDDSDDDSSDDSDDSDDDSSDDGGDYDDGGSDE